MPGGTGFSKTEILLVDDRVENLVALEAVLSDPGYDLFRARSGDEALRFLLDHNPALILMDVQMPGLDGYETAAIIKSSERTREIPIVFVTAINTDERFALKGYAHGAVDYIYKPYDPYILRSKVTAFVEMKRQWERVARLVAVQEATTLALAESQNLNEAVAKVLKSICVSLGWDVGAYWGFDRRTSQLQCRAEWHGGHRDLSEFLAESFSKSYFPGLGLPGRVWAAKKTIWLPDYSADPQFSRQLFACRAGLKTAVGMPVGVHDEVMGVFEFFSHRRQEEDLPLIKILGAIGSQVGQVLSRNKAFELVQAAESRKAAVLESALDCIISTDHEGRITEFNPAAESTFRRTRAEALGKPMAEIIFPPKYRDTYHQSFARGLVSRSGALIGQRTEMVGMRADGSEFPVELSVVRVDISDQPQFTGFLRDISDRKKSERDATLLEEASASLTASLDSNEVLTVLCRLTTRHLADWCVVEMAGDEEGTVKPSLTLVQRDSSHQRGEALHVVLDGGGAGLAGTSQVICSGRSAIHPDVGEDLFAGCQADPAFLERLRSTEPRSAMAVPLTCRGRVLGAMILAKLSTDRRYASTDLPLVEELARRAAMALDNARLYDKAQSAISTRDEFFSIASHELKTPITSLKMQLEMTQRILKLESQDNPSVARLSKILGTSSRQTDRLTHLVEDLLDVVKIRAGKLQFELSEHDLSELVSDVLQGHRDIFSAAQCEVNFVGQPKILGDWDRGRLEQVVVNLVGNAVKYAPGKPIDIEVSAADGVARLIVRDQGPGIAADRQGRIFERFERAVSSRNISGLGLGLFIAKQIVEGHHGTIRVESLEGQGAAFIVELPARAVSGAEAGSLPGLAVRLENGAFSGKKESSAGA